MGGGQLSQLVDVVRDRGMLTVLGGSLDAATIPRVMSVRPDYVAVRGAACKGTRTGTIEQNRVRELATLIDCQTPAWESQKFSS